MHIIILINQVATGLGKLLQSQGKIRDFYFESGDIEEII